MRLNLTVNGIKHEIDIPPSKLLLDVIREDLELTGTKYGCGTGDCGVCTVLFDGVPVTSCTMLAAQANNHEVTTIEGIRNDPLFKKIETAFVAKGAVQCGYCTPGFIMSAVKLLEEEPLPTEMDIKQGLSGNICRCTGYYSIMEAVKKASLKIENHT